MRHRDFIAFIKLREAARVAKELGRPRPWSSDPIIATYRFCNVHREDDRVTRDFATLLREPYRDDRHLWFAYAVARCAINRTDTMLALLTAIGKRGAVTWQPERAREILKARRATGMTIYGAAYMIGTQGNAGDKIDFLIDKVLTPLWEDRKAAPYKSDKLGAWHLWLTSHYAVGSFTAAQVLADVKFAHPERWSDFDTFAASGPGSRRGLNRVYDRDIDARWPGDTWFKALEPLVAAVRKALGPSFHAQDVQNCLCEFDKYERARLGEGRPKQLYVSHEEK